MTDRRHSSADIRQPDAAHWHTLEGLRDCPDGCVAPASIPELEDNILRNHDANLRTWRAGHVNCEGCAIRRRRGRPAAP